MSWTPTDKDVYGQESEKPHYRIIWPAAYPMYYNEARENSIIACEDCWLYPDRVPETFKKRNK